MTSDQLASMYAEIVLGTAKKNSRFAGEPDFDALWDSTAAQVKTIREDHDHVVFEIPNEVPSHPGG